MAWLTSLAGGWVRRALYGETLFYGGLRLVHLLGMAEFFTVVVLIDLRMLGRLRTLPNTLTRQHLPRLAWVGFAITFSSGVLLFLMDPIGAGLHSLFVAKLALIALGGLNTALFHLADKSRQVLVRSIAAASLIFWTGAIACSTWNHVERPFRPKSIPSPVSAATKDVEVSSN